MLQKKKVFSGAGVALITPFKDGKIDYKALDVILEQQIAGGTDAIIACGTTAEAATLSDFEHKEIISHCIEKVNGRIPVIAGTGSNHTDYAIELTKFAKDEGADGVLLVTPYYNKASQKSLVKHFLSIAECAEIPNILYNVPSRTGLNISLSAYDKLAEHPNIVATKEASGNLSAIMQVLEVCGDRLDVYSGNDDQIVPLMCMGAIGVISVLSNVMPKETHEMAKLCLEGNFREAAKLQLKYLSLINGLFMQVNPIPVKTAMAKMGFCSTEMRMPLCEMDEEDNEKLYALMKDANLI
ncbi:MAG: 4-hydroxy-tetrahydrodipicolinate synthase [Clostridia bacterium]|nr:4-hydroxy-tetrahydrodipicolinate synthase [Clostridia bacterium]